MLLIRSAGDWHCDVGELVVSDAPIAAHCEAVNCIHGSLRAYIYIYVYDGLPAQKAVKRSTREIPRNFGHPRFSTRMLANTVNSKLSEWLPCMITIESAIMLLVGWSTWPVVHVGCKAVPLILRPGVVDKS